MIILYGPRQAGKTTLINSLLAELGKEHEYFTGDDLYAQSIFGKNELESLKKLAKTLLGLTSTQIAIAVGEGSLVEVEYEA